MKMSLEEVRQHVPGIVTEDMLRFARDHVFEDLHFIFITCKGNGKERKRVAHCCHCGHNFGGDGLKHAKNIACPNCRYESTVYYAWYSTRPCVRFGSMVYWQKSEIDANTVTAIAVDLKLDMAGYIAQIGVPVIEANLTEMFVFTPGKGSVRFTKYWSGWGRTIAIRNPISNQTRPAKMADYTFHQSVAGTDFERMGVRDFDPWYSIECLDMASKWPSFEYINKLGFNYLLKDKMVGNQTFGAINWNGKSMVSVLGLTKDDVKEIKRISAEIDFCSLYILRRMRKSGYPTTVSEAINMSSVLSQYGKSEIDEMFKMGNPKRRVDYYKQQMKIIAPSGRPFYGWSSAAHSDYKDYRAQCIALGLDLSDTAICWPNDLHQAHQNLTTQIEYKKNADLDKKVKLRAARLRNYAYSWGEIAMHPFVSSKEIIDEGKALNHCVGGYVKRYADGGTILCALRRAEAPETPWHTVEFTTDGRLVQCRGMRNQTSAEDKPLLDAFWAAFEEHRTKKVRKSA